MSKLVPKLPWQRSFRNFNHGSPHVGRALTVGQAMTTCICWQLPTEFRHDPAAHRPNRQVIVEISETGRRCSREGRRQMREAREHRKLLLCAPRKDLSQPCRHPPNDMVGAASLRVVYLQLALREFVPRLSPFPGSDEICTATCVNAPVDHRHDDADRRGPSRALYTTRSRTSPEMADWLPKLQ